MNTIPKIANTNDTVDRLMAEIEALKREIEALKKSQADPGT